MKLAQWFYRYWVELLVFGAVFTIFMVDLAPDYTFISKAADSIGYAYSAKYLYPSYHTSPPLYLLVSHLFINYIPFGTDAWRMGLVSVLSSMGACVFIFLAIRVHLPSSKFYPILGVLIYGTSALVISQSTIIQTYATICMAASGAYYFALLKKWKLMALMLGIGLAVHALMGFVFVIMLVAYREYRKNWKALLITLSFGIFYIYMPLTHRPPYMWFPDPQQLNAVWSFITDVLATAAWLIMKLSIWDLPKRILDTIGLVGVSIGVLTIVPIFFYFWKTKFYRNVLFWLIMAPILIFVTELDMNTYDYTMLAIPFLAIVSCLGLDIMVRKYGVKAVHFRTATVIVVIGFGIFNANFFDIGRTLDPNMSASKLYHVEFAKIPDDAIFMPNYAWEWEAIYKYNMDYGKNIYPICIDVLPSENYQEQLRNDDIVFVESNHLNRSVLSKEVAMSIVALNDNVWTTVSTDPSTFGTEVVNANGDTSLIVPIDIERITQMEQNPQWAWKPYNPYDIITASITVTHWNYVLLSNWSVSFFITLAAIGLLLNWLVFILPQRRSRKEEEEYL